jgi:hypothetical protein
MATLRFVRRLLIWESVQQLDAALALHPTIPVIGYTTNAGENKTKQNKTKTKQ